MRELCYLQFAADWEAVRVHKEQGKTFMLTVLRANSGGLTVKFNSLQVFVPNHLIAPHTGGSSNTKMFSTISAPSNGENRI